MSNETTRHTPRVAWLGAMGALLLLSGCVMQPATSTNPSGSVIVGQPQGTSLDASLNGFLANAPAGAIVNLASSPWGGAVEVMADAPYRAASGRLCRHLTVQRQSNASQQDVVACETPSGWVSHRRVTALYNGMEPSL
ncbi:MULTISPECIES: DVU3141 family protein [unclassified Halomonas]|uniref:DVU3141 family protein n=1 Tax=unclassified Halomonas TaxID=2609666 RepID=UPI001C9699E0|nr:MULTISPECIES: DVU3141 family protein [unclassified Halomonas]MBY5924899.1 hypothetical protein [Halomonas sp. DP4Y7-2]MBY6231941.1 hypothetical protein [Halomonas sp. DP4Y7-1]